MNSTQHGKEEFDKKYYSRYSFGSNEFEVYKSWFTGWWRFIYKRLGNKRLSGKSALEVGCSIGAFTSILQKVGLEVTATDISPYVLDKAKKLQQGPKFEILNIEKQPHPKKFDYIFCFEVLEHLEDSKKGLENLKKSLRPSGTLVFSTPFVTKQSLSDPTHINVHNPAWWIRAASKSGFKSVKYYPATFIPYLYKVSPLFSWGFPVKIDLPFVNTTCFFFFRK